MESKRQLDFILSSKYTVTVFSFVINYPTKKEILAYFEVVEKALRGLRNAVNLRQTVIEAQLERIKYSLF